MVYTMNNCVVDGKYPKEYLNLLSSNSIIPVNAYVIYSTGSHQQESTTVLVHDSKNSFKFIVPERSFGGHYKDLTYIRSFFLIITMLQYIYHSYY